MALIRPERAPPVPPLPLPAKLGKEDDLMKLLSINVSRPKEVRQNGRIITTGIFKESVPGRVMLRTLNLDGDGQADLNAHGGVHKAAYAYSIENYEYWKRELGRDDFRYGQFGENFTVEGMLEDAVHLGDVFRVGGALVQVSEPRTPCAKLALKMGLPQFPKRFLASERVGFYLRVLREGEVGAGDVIERVETDPERMTVRQFVHLAYFDEGNLEGVRQALRVRALPLDWREWLEGVLAKAGTASSERADCCVAREGQAEASV
jgi:MOSC domain-containing protein YiiM